MGGGAVGYLCFYIWNAVSVDSYDMYGNRSLIGRQLRVDSFGRSGAAVEIGLGGRYEAIQGVWVSRFVSPYMIVQFRHGKGKGGEKFLRWEAWNFTVTRAAEKKNGKFD